MGGFSGGMIMDFVVGHITPEAYCGGAIAIIRNGDKITIGDAEKQGRSISNFPKRKNCSPPEKMESAETPLTPAECLQNTPSS